MPYAGFTDNKPFSAWRVVALSLLLRQLRHTAAAAAAAVVAVMTNAAQPSRYTALFADESCHLEADGCGPAVKHE